MIQIKETSWLSLVELSGMKGEPEKVCGKGMSNPDNVMGDWYSVQWEGLFYSVRRERL